MYDCMYKINVQFLSHKCYCHCNNRDNDHNNNKNNNNNKHEIAVSRLLYIS